MNNVETHISHSLVVEDVKG